MLEKKTVLGVGITNANMQEILEYITKGLAKNTKKYFVVTPNPEILVIANKNRAYKKTLNSANLALTDGVGVMLAGKIMGRPFKDRVTGVDLLENLCRQVAEKPITVGFLGGRDNVADRTAKCLVSKFSGLKVAFAGAEWPKNAGVAGEVGRGKLKINNDVKKNSQLYIDVLFVAFGAPKQEIWINKNLEKLPIKVAIGVGGAFDYLSGKVPRAPDFIQKLGFEWLFRLIRQPWRLKRQLALLEFIFLVLKEKVSSKIAI